MAQVWSNTRLWIITTTTRGKMKDYQLPTLVTLNPPMAMVLVHNICNEHFLFYPLLSSINCHIFSICGCRQKYIYLNFQIQEHWNKKRLLQMWLFYWVCKLFNVCTSWLHFTLMVQPRLRTKYRVTAPRNQGLELLESMGIYIRY